MEKVVTYVEMTSPDQLQPATPAVGVALRRLPADSSLIPDVQSRVGAPYHWRSSVRTPAQWQEWLSHPLRQYWLITHEDEPAGIANFEPQPAGDVEITTFGLLPEQVGKRRGGYALTLVIRQAWNTPPADGERAARVWLHTCNSDHPNALGNYLARGFTVFRSDRDGQQMS
jgi:hypothetical protein